MARAGALFAVLALGPGMAEGCAKVFHLQSSSATPAASAASASPPTPVPSVTAPPVWSPPDPGGPAPLPASTAPASPELAKARAFALAGEHKKVRALLEKRIKAGKGTREEAALLAESCMAIRDKACIEAVRAMYPDVDVR